MADCNGIKIINLAEKTALDNDDFLVITDSDVGNVVKKAKAGNFTDIVNRQELISTDSGNIITTGVDGGLFAEETSPVSTDINNEIVEGVDGKAYYRQSLTENTINVGNPGNLPDEKTFSEVNTLLGVDILQSQVITGVMHVRDEKPNNTPGGASVSGRQTRVLNTVKVNTISGAILSSNQITLPAGTYKIYARVPSLSAEHSRAYLYNATDTVDILRGSNCFSDTASFYASTESIIIGYITINDTKDLEVQHYTRQAFSPSGLGAQVVADTGVEVYTEIFIEKIGQ